VVAADQEAGAVGPPHFPGEEQASAVVAPVGIVQVAGDDDESDVLSDRQIDQVRECAARALPGHAVGHGAKAGEPEERTVQVNIGGVQEFHAEEVYMPLPSPPTTASEPKALASPASLRDRPPSAAR